MLREHILRNCVFFLFFLWPFSYFLKRSKSLIFFKHTVFCCVITTHSQTICCVSQSHLITSIVWNFKYAFLGIRLLYRGLLFNNSFILFSINSFQHLFILSLIFLSKSRTDRDTNSLWVILHCVSSHNFISIQ